MAFVKASPRRQHEKRSYSVIKPSDVAALDRVIEAKIKQNRAEFVAGIEAGAIHVTR